MYALVVTMLFIANGDLTNSHRVIPLSEKKVEAPVVEMEEDTLWEVVTTNGNKSYVLASGSATQGDLILMQDSKDNVVMVIHKERFVSARKMRKNEKLP
jgi:hypothetical protein